MHGGFIYFIGTTYRPTKLKEYDHAEGEQVNVNGYMDTLMAFNLETNDWEFNGVEVQPDQKGKHFDEMSQRALF